jgi:hypothetical protein
MSVTVKWGASGPILQKPGVCPSCGQPFACELSLSGCWCSTLSLTDDDRAQLRARFDGCLCPACLTQFAVVRHP